MLTPETFLRFLPLDRDAAVGGRRAHQRPARAKSYRELPVDLATDGHWKIDFDMSVDGSGFEARRIIRRYRHGDATVGCAGIELAAFPAASGELDRQAAVRRMPVHI